ncbi:cell division protein FtsZ [Candidatus Dependentiae bacterium]|nr:cell division protein FtsZ [Candidatus Dependentiae bacterium]
MIRFEEEPTSLIAPVANIKVIGVGGAGCNTVNSMIENGAVGIDFIVTNTDAQTLATSKAPVKLQMGMKSTKGLGAGANPELGRRAAEEDIDKIMDSLAGADMVFLTGGMGGGTGSGALPVIARALKEKDVLTIAVVTKPFTFEGKRRMKVANDALNCLSEYVDTLIVLPNQRLIELVDQKVSLVGAFNMINNVLNQFVRSISDIITRPGHINVDFADVKTIMKNQGYAVIGTARATGEDRATKAANQALSSSLLENMNIKGARSVLLNITGNADVGLHEVSAAASIMYEQAHEDANIILGSVIDDSCDEEVIVTIIATGFEHQIQKNIAEQLHHKIDISPKVQAQIYKAAEQEVTNDGNLNIDDLDIPTYMRKKAQESSIK